MSDRESRGWHRRRWTRSPPTSTSSDPVRCSRSSASGTDCVNVNTVQLEQLLDGGPALPFGMVDPIAVPNDEEAMTDYLTTGGAATACLLLTARGTVMEIEPIVDADLMAQAARDAGFVRRTTLDLPDHRTVVVWRRPSSCPVTAG